MRFFKLFNLFCSSTDKLDSTLEKGVDFGPFFGEVPILLLEVFVLGWSCDKRLLPEDLEFLHNARLKILMD